MTLSKGAHSVLLYNGRLENDLEIQVNDDLELEVDTILGKPFIKTVN